MNNILFTFAIGIFFLMFIINIGFSGVKKDHKTIINYLESQCNVQPLDQEQKEK